MYLREKSIWKKVARTIAPRKSEKGHGSSRPSFSMLEFENMLRLPVERKRPKEKNKKAKNTKNIVILFPGLNLFFFISIKVYML